MRKFALARTRSPATLARIQPAMNQSPSNAERVFAEAIELPRGEARARLVVERCGNDPALRDEVESLLRAHDGAGDFLNPPPPKPTSLIVPPVALAQSTAVMNPAAHAEAFLRACSNPTAEQREQFLAQLPEAVRNEARERIQAGLHVRELRERERRPPSEREEQSPRLPGFRLERKLGEGGLGVVYAAHDEKLNRRVAIKVLRPRADAQVRQRV